jgi:hypothetical protein
MRLLCDYTVKIGWAEGHFIKGVTGLLDDPDEL